MADERIGLHTLAPPPRGARRPRKRIGRGQGSGFGKTSGRGQKGAGSRSGSKRKAGYEGGQNPLHMRMRKLRGPHMKKSMPFEPFRTHTQPVNLSDLNRFDDGAEVTPEALRERGLATRKRVPVKILAQGRARAQEPRTCPRTGSAPRRAEKIEAAGGTCTVVEFEPRANAEERPSDRHDRQRLQRPRDPAEDPLHGCDPGALPARRPHPRARASTSTRSRRSTTSSAASNILGFLNLFSGGGAPELRDLLARDHALHHGVDHPAAADGRRAVAGEAAEGGRGRPAEDHPVHALPDGRARGRRSRSASCSCSGRSAASRATSVARQRSRSASCS